MSRSTLLRGAVALTATVTAVALPALVLGPSAHAKGKPKGKSSVSRLAPGVTLTQSTFSYQGSQRAFTLRVDLSAHTQLTAAGPHRVVGAPRATTLAIGRQENAVAGVNGDTFYFFDNAAVPRGGYSYNGKIMKSALYRQNATFYTTRTGHAYIGNPGFGGTIAALDRAGHRRGFKIRSINSIENARNGGLSLIDPSVLTSSLNKKPQKKHACTLVRLQDLGGTAYRVKGIDYKPRNYSRAAAGTHALLSCSDATKTWVRSALFVGQKITASAGYAAKGVTALISGNKQLIRNGRRFNDRSGLSVYGNQKKPETFACVLRGNRSVLLGVVEGDRKGRAGMTYKTLTSYLLARKCVSAMVLDGSGSSTFVAKRPGHRLATLNKTTAPGGPRKVVNGLYVVRR